MRLAACGQTHGRTLRRSCLSGLALLLAAGGAFAIEPFRPLLPPPPSVEQPFDVVKIQQRIRLEPIRPDEILIGGLQQAITEGLWSPGALAGMANPANTRIVRTLPSVWRMRLRDENDLQNLVVSVDVSAPDGTFGRLGLFGGGNADMRATIRTLDPVIVLRTQQGITIEGGVVLTLDVDQVRVSGRYTGTLTVTVERF